jgi:hypothetical protein
MAALSAGQDVFLRLPPEKCVIVRDDAPAPSPVSADASPVAVSATAAAAQVA